MAARLETVGEFIDQRLRVTRFCQWCNEFAEVDLDAIAREKGAGFSLIDKMPYCTNGDCFGLIRFKVQRGIREAWLLTDLGQRQFQAHCDFMFTYRQVLLKRNRQKAARARRASRPGA